MVKADVPNYDNLPSVPEQGDIVGWHPELPRAKFDEKMLGRKLVIQEIDLRESTMKEGAFYALIRATCLDKQVTGELEEQAVIVEPGQEFTTSTGRVRIVGKLRKVESFPVKGQVVVAGKTSTGFPLWDLVPY